MSLLAEIGWYSLRILSWIDPIDPTKVTDFKQVSGDIEEQFIETFSRELIVYLGVLVLIGFGYTLAVDRGYILSGKFGLIFSAVGSISLARSAVRGKAGIAAQTHEEIKPTIQAGPAKLDESALTAECRKTVHGVFGAFLLFLGFTIQLI